MSTTLFDVSTVSRHATVTTAVRLTVASRPTSADNPVRFVFPALRLTQIVKEGSIALAVVAEQLEQG